MERVSDRNELWVPHDSTFYKNFKFLEENRFDPFDIAKQGRLEIFAYTKNPSENLLTLKNFKTLAKLNDLVMNFTDESGFSFEDLCVRLPKKELQDLSQTNKEFKAQIFASLPMEARCNLVERILEEKEWTCIAVTPFNFLYQEDLPVETVMERLKSDKELRDLLVANKSSSVTGKPLTYNSLFGDWTADNDSSISFARSTRMSYPLNVTEKNDFEVEISAFIRGHAKELEDLNVLVLTRSGLESEIKRTTKPSIPKVVMGFVIMQAFLLLNLGRLNMVEQRALLSFAGMISSISALVTTLGFCSVLGFYYGPMHAILPYLLFGIGIDDMFVIMQSLSSVKLDQDPV